MASAADLVESSQQLAPKLAAGVTAEQHPDHQLTLLLLLLLLLVISYTLRTVGAASTCMFIQQSSAQCEVDAHARG
jgi:hypothetical protein